MKTTTRFGLIARNAPSTRFARLACAHFARRFERLALCAACLLTPASLYADTPSPGYSLQVAPNPAGLGQSFAPPPTVTLGNGNIVAFDSLDINLYNQGGSFIQQLGTIGAVGYPSFLRLNPAGTAVVLGESKTHNLWTVPLNASGAVLLTTIMFNFDAVFEPGGDLIVSAGTGNGPPNTNELIRVNAATGAQTSLGFVDGFSGPLAIGPAGDLYYATSLFPLPQSTDVIFWTAAQLQGAQSLSTQNATVFATGFEGGFSLDFDPVSGKLYMGETNFSTSVFQIRQVHIDAGQSPTVAVSRHPVGNLEFIQTGSASFDAYQPPDGVHLKYNSGDVFLGTANQVTVKPSLNLSGPGLNGVGAVTLTLTDGVPGGSAFLLFTPQAFLSPTFQALPLGGFLWHTHFNPNKVRRGSAFHLPTDPNGTTTFTIFNSGNLQGLFAFQFLVGNPSGAFLGASTEAAF
jgi:hypothetical protein